MAMGGSGSMGRQSFMPRFNSGYTGQSFGTGNAYRPGGQQPQMYNPTSGIGLPQQPQMQNPTAPYSQEPMTGGPSMMSFQNGQQGWGRPNTGIQLPQRPQALPGAGTLPQMQPQTPELMNQAGPSTLAQTPAIAQAPRSNPFMSEWGGTGNVFDPTVMAQNGWSFGADGSWNGAIPDEYRNTASRGDGFTGIRNGFFYVNGRDIVGENYLGGKLDPNNLGSMGGGGTIRDMLGTQGFVGRGNGGGGGLMAPQAAATRPTAPAATRPAAPVGNPGNPLPGPGAGPRGGAPQFPFMPSGKPIIPGQRRLPWEY